MIWQTNIVRFSTAVAHLNYNLTWKEAIRKEKKMVGREGMRDDVEKGSHESNPS